MKIQFFWNGCFAAPLRVSSGRGKKKLFRAPSKDGQAKSLHTKLETLSLTGRRELGLKELISAVVDTYIASLRAKSAFITESTYIIFQAFTAIVRKMIFS
jgi:hypothetical protein